MLLESCADNYYLIRMSAWLEEAASAANESARSYIKPCVESKLVFRQLHSDKLSSAISCVGNVLDAADIDPSQSSMECQPLLRVGEEICIALKAISESGSSVSFQVDDVSMTSLDVKVMSPDTVLSEISAEPLSTFAPVDLRRYYRKAKLAPSR